MHEGALERGMFDFVEAIHVELSDEAVDLVVAEVFRQDKLLQFGTVTYDKLCAISGPMYDLMILLVLIKIKLYIEYLVGLGNEPSNLHLIVS